MKILMLLFTVHLSLMTFGASDLQSFFYNTEVDDSTTAQWKTLELSDVGSFIFPSHKMEIQNADLKNLNDSIRAMIPVAPTKLTLQQRGLNSGTNYKYARVLVEQLVGESSDFLPSTLSISALSEEEKEQIKTFYKQSVSEGFAAIGVTITKWYSVELLEINGSFCVHLKYHRASTVQKGDVIVNLYCFPDDSREIDLTLSCRVDNTSEWNDDFIKIANSFKLK